MATAFFLVFLALFQSLLVYTVAEEKRFFKDCQSFHCGKLHLLRFPFTNKTQPSHCGPFVVDGCDKEVQKIQLVRETGKWYEVESISQANTILVIDREFQRHLESKQCESFNNLSLPNLSYASFKIHSNLTLLKCDHSVHVTIPHLDFCYTYCKNFSIHYGFEDRSLPSLPPNCSIVQLPINKSRSYDHMFGLLTAKFSVEVHVLPHCYWCELGGRHKCQYNSNGAFECARANEGAKKLGLILGLALGLGWPAAIMIILFLILFIRHQHKGQYADGEGGNAFLSVSTFSHTELEEATNNFDSEKELEHGVFGTVYYGKLQDGREIAVKRLYGHNYKRVQQFMNEIEILKCLDHKNLVSLYGCSSYRSHKLLLVYEYISNGSVADHLHGNQANLSPLTWPIRLRIATETASALAYLHASNVIHQDVKTNNILLDNNFCVKVADFGLFRLFPNDISHYSIAQEGTSSYWDQEYQQCCLLTNKSDVYSFGVVLIELISSMPAVDTTRQQHKINLADFAINKIKKCELDELVDPSIGYKSDEEVKRMTTLVAQLAFCCLQQDQELRPSMDEVLEELERIERTEYKFRDLEEQDNNEIPKSTKPPILPPGCDEVALLKNVHPPPSPNLVTDKWISSSSTTCNKSG